jgi:SAM-dependent methyltransferase
MKPIFKRYEYSEEVELSLNKHQLEAIQKFKNKVDNKYKFEEAVCLCGATPGSSESILIACKDRYGLEVKTWLSLKSGLLWSSPRLDQKGLEAFYDEDYRDIYVGGEELKSTFYIKQIHRGLSIKNFVFETASVSLKNDAVVFDIGCGAGGALEAFRDIGCKVFGCDYGTEYLAYGRQRGLKLVYGGIAAMSEFGKADLIILSHVLEHSSDPLNMLKEAKNLLAEGGCIYINVPGIKNLSGDYKNNLLLFLQNAHLFHFSKNSLTVVGIKAGLEPIFIDDSVKAVFKESQQCNNKDWDNLEAKSILEYINSQEKQFVKKTSSLSIVRVLSSVINKLLSYFGLRCMFH